MNEFIAEQQEMWVAEEIEKFYWAFADDLSDEGSAQLDMLLNGEFKDKLKKILAEDARCY